MSTLVRSKKNVKNVSARLFSGITLAILAAAALMGAGCDKSTGSSGGGDGTPSPVTLDNLENFMVQVEGGAFDMGCRNDEESEPVCRKKTGTDEDTCVTTCLPKAANTTVASFYICKFEVTQGLWKEVMGATDNPSEFKGDNLPVTNIIGTQINTFISSLNTNKEGGGYTYRLLTEAEWEYAARGGNQSAGYIYSGSNNAGEVAWYGGINDGSKSRPRPVDDPNLRPNELGIHSMSGNVWEVVQVGNTNRAERGGSWFGKESFCRVTYRNYLVNAAGVDALSDRGFRIAATLKQ